MCGLFGTSGIRRKVSELPPEFAVRMGQALGTTTGFGTVAVGRDTRSSGPLLESSLVSGILSTGCNVVELGVVSTPTVGVATSDYGVGVMVTASHNPPDYNGFKFWSRDGAFRPGEEKNLEDVFEGRVFRKGYGSEVSGDYVGRHIDLILGHVGAADGVNVLLDCAGGSGSSITPGLLEGMGCNVTVVNDNTDGVFPHPLEPTESNLAETCRMVREGGYDIAFAHDGDADRTAAIDSGGRLVEWDSFLAVLAYGLDRVVTTVDASMRVEEVCGEVIRVPVGDVAVAEGIRENKAGFGGEPSGTYIFPDIHIYPDGVATVAKTVSMVSEGSFYDILSGIPSYPVERVKIPCAEGDKAVVMGKLTTVIDSEYTTVDGVRVQWDDAWILIRPSGTEPYMRITAEARDSERLKEVVGKGRAWLSEAGLQ
ncbi:MAG: phosphopentomutase/phosphoglucosamine mutase [Candidatus Altiarchaeota archaeon]